MSKWVLPKHERPAFMKECILWAEAEINALRPVQGIQIAFCLRDGVTRITWQRNSGQWITYEGNEYMIGNPQTAEPPRFSDPDIETLYALVTNPHTPAHHRMQHFLKRAPDDVLAIYADTYRDVCRLPYSMYMAGEEPRMVAVAMTQTLLVHRRSRIYEDAATTQYAGHLTDLGHEAACAECLIHAAHAIIKWADDNNEQEEEQR